MKKFLTVLLAGLLAAMCVPFSGCSSSSGKTILKICNCEDYIDEELLDMFEERYPDIKVEYSTYGTNENLYNELVINPNSYDLVVPSEYMIQKLATEGRLNKLDHDKLSGYEPSPYIEERLENITFTVESGEYKGEEAKLSDFMVGYMWGTMGWVINPGKVNADDAKSWDGILGNKKYNKKVTLKDSVRDTYLVSLALIYKNELLTAINNGNFGEVSEWLNKTDKETVKKVGDKLSSLKNSLYGFEVDSGKNDIVTGKIDAYVAWSGDAAYAIDEAEEKKVHLDYVVPEEGSNIWFDGLVMPSGSKNYDAVYKFLNFISEPENVVKNMDYIGYSSIVAAPESGVIFDYIADNFDEREDEETGEVSTEGLIEVDLSYYFGNEDGENVVYVSEESYGRLMAQYPTQDIIKRCAVMNYFDNETLTIINDMWAGVKGETFNTSTIIMVLVLVLIIIAAIVLYRLRDKIKWLKLPESKRSYAEKHDLKVVSREIVQ
ncbi:MAG TPA: hypothetical protein DHU65_06900 [Clostridiales bacterium]|nr:hypothetical protein [Clostridiales bacterium]